MKNKKQIKVNLAFKRFKKRLKRKEKKRLKKKKINIYKINLIRQLRKDRSLINQIENWLPSNLKYILSIEKANFLDVNIVNDSNEKTINIKVPKHFCLISNSKESYDFIREFTLTVLSDRCTKINLDYSSCNKIELSAQVFFDAIYRDLAKFLHKRKTFKKTLPILRKISGININNINNQKLLFSVGSPAIITKDFKKYKDIIPYNLCVHNKSGNKLKNEQRAEVDSTELVDYVIDSLSLLDKKLTVEAIENLSIVIGEILINAEEHSTTNYRFSIGYFQKFDKGDDSFGIFHLVIMNFGESIYEKFKSPDCENIAIKNKMQKLSDEYTTKRFFNSGFEEETLWTLYALQDGVTSISKEKYKRGNGSIKFIESFFNLKGTKGNADNVSQLTIVSGNTNIIFDGTYEIENRTIESENFKVMTFNKTGNIKDKPDKKYVKFVSEYFPGTIISAKMLINKDDIEYG